MLTYYVIDEMLLRGYIPLGQFNNCPYFAPICIHETHRAVVNLLQRPSEKYPEWAFMRNTYLKACITTPVNHFLFMQSDYNIYEREWPPPTNSYKRDTDQTVFTTFFCLFLGRNINGSRFGFFITGATATCSKDETLITKIFAMIFSDSLWHDVTFDLSFFPIKTDL